MRHWGSRTHTLDAPHGCRETLEGWRTFTLYVCVCVCVLGERRAGLTPYASRTTPLGAASEQQNKMHEMCGTMFTGYVNGATFTHLPLTLTVSTPDTTHDASRLNPACRTGVGHNVRLMSTSVQFISLHHSSIGRPSPRVTCICDASAGRGREPGGRRARAWSGR